MAVLEAVRVYCCALFYNCNSIYNIIPDLTFIYL